MIKKLFFLLVAFSVSIAYAVTVQNTVAKGRSVEGNLVSDVDEQPEVPVFGNFFDPVTTDVNTATISWSQVTADTNGAPVTIVNYEVRYRIVGTTEYQVALVPAAYTGLATDFAVGSYEGYVEAVATNGFVSQASTFTFEVP